MWLVIIGNDLEELDAQDGIEDMAQHELLSLINKAILKGRPTPPDEPYPGGDLGMISDAILGRKR